MSLCYRIELRMACGATEWGDLGCAGAHSVWMAFQHVETSAGGTFSL
jgi:hypothetical protein